MQPAMHSPGQPASYPCLVLNADFAPLSFFPLSVWDFGRTLRNVLKERAIVVDTYDALLRSPSFEYRPPSVVALKQYVKRARGVAFTRLNVFLRDSFRCQYCGEPFPAKELTFDHVVPRSQGGGTNWENIVSACGPCNQAKSDRRDLKPITRPRAPDPFELAAARRLPRESLHQSWIDYLYWDSALESD